MISLIARLVKKKGVVAKQPEVDYWSVLAYLQLADRLSLSSRGDACGTSLFRVAEGMVKDLPKLSERESCRSVKGLAAELMRFYDLPQNAGMMSPTKSTGG